MGVKINLPKYFLPYTNGIDIVEVNGSTVGECLTDLLKQHSEVGKIIFNEKGQLRGDILLSINRTVAAADLAKPVNTGDEIQILYIIGGG